MSGFNYVRAKATADRLITKFGKTTQSQLLEPGTKSGSAFDPTISDDITHDVKAVVLDYKQSEIDGSRVLAGDRRVYIAVGSLTATPTPEWKLKIKMATDDAAKIYRIVNVKPLEPGDITVMLELQCRI